MHVLFVVKVGKKILGQLYFFQFNKHYQIYIAIKISLEPEFVKLLEPKEMAGL